jgi:hypothetical protein
LRETPEVFETVGVDFPVHVTFGVVNDFVNEILVESLIGEQRVGVNRAASGDVVTDFSLDSVLPPIRNNADADLPAAFENAHDRSFVFGASFGDADAALVLVHESRRATDESLVHFDFTANHSESLILQGRAGCDAS